MQKHLLTVIAGTAAVVLAGCYNPNKVVIQRKYKPAPEQPAPIADNMSEPKELAPGSTGTLKTAEYEPMTDAVPTGGVDSVDAKNASPKASSSSGTYIVKKGDTLGRIARRHKVKLSALMAANNMDEQNWSFPQAAKLPLFQTDRKKNPQRLKKMRPHQLSLLTENIP